MRTESRIAPPAPFEIEALPPIEGQICTVILYENISGELEKEDGEKYYTYDRYTVETPYRAALAESVQANRAEWLAKAIAAENAEPAETLEEQVERLQSEKAQLESQLTDVQMALCDVYELL